MLPRIDSATNYGPFSHQKRQTLESPQPPPPLLPAIASARCRSQPSLPATVQVTASHHRNLTTKVALAPVAFAKEEK